MRLTGNLSGIKIKRDSRNQDIALQVDQIEYITYKKDGKYFQPFEFIDELETPLVLTGDCLAKSAGKAAEEDEIIFDVYDKTGDDYQLNPDKQLSVTMTYDEEADLHILRSLTYTVTVPNEEFNTIRRERANQKKQQKGRRNR